MEKLVDIGNVVPRIIAILACCSAPAALFYQHNKDK